LGRILLLVLIGFLIWLLLRGYFKSQLRRPEAPSTAVKGEDMVSCARCGVNLPRSEAIEDNGRLVCRDNPQCVEAPK